MKKTTLIISISLVLALIAGSVFAWGHGKGRGIMGAGHGGQYCRGYGAGTAYNDLSKEQQGQLATLRQAFIDETYELRSTRLEIRQQVRLLMQTSSPDRAKLDALYDEMDAVQKQLRDKRTDFLLEAKKIAPDFNFGYGRGFGGKGHGGRKPGSGQDCWRGEGGGPNTYVN